MSFPRLRQRPEFSHSLTTWGRVKDVLCTGLIAIGIAVVLVVVLFGLSWALCIAAAKGVNLPD